MKRLLPLVLAFLVACGYHLVGTQPRGKRLNLAGKNIYIEPFKNRTDEPNIEYYITDRLASSLLKTGKISITDSEHCQFIIRGEVVSYTKEVVAVDSSGDVSVYRLNVSVNVRVYDSSGREVASYQGISHYEDYPVSEKVETTKAHEREAMRKIAGDIAQQISSLLL